MIPTLLIAPFAAEVDENCLKWGIEGEERKEEEEAKERGSSRVERSMLVKVESASVSNRRESSDFSSFPIFAANR